MIDIKRKKAFAIVTILVTIAIIYWCYKFYADGIYSSNYNAAGLSMYYTINSFGNFLPFYIFLGFLATNFLATNYYKNKYSKFDNFVITRVKRKKRIKYEIKSILIWSFIFRVLLHILVLIIINYFFVELHFSFYKDPSYYPNGFFTFSNSSLGSLIIFTIYSSIGFSIFSLFIYSLISYIKNYYVYKISGIIMAIIGVLLPAFIGNIYLSHYSNYSFLVTAFMYSIYSGGLLCPGLEILNQLPSTLILHIYFFVSCIGYTILSVILILIRYREEKKYG